MKITVDETLKKITGTGNPSGLIVRNTGSETAFMAFEEPASAAALQAGDAQGVPLKPDEVLAFSGRDMDLNGAIYFSCVPGLSASSTTINYTFKA